MKKISKIILTGLISLSFAHLLFGNDLYVSPQGDDDNPGTLSQPLNSLEAARNAILTQKMTGVTVWLRGGDYMRSASFELNEQNSGTEHAPIVYRGFEGEYARLVGGMDIPSSAFIPVTNQNVLEQIQPSARSNILQVDLIKLGIPDFGQLTPRGFGRQKYPAPMEVFFNSQRMIVARWPNEGYVRIEGLPPAEDLIGSGGKVRGKDTDRFFFNDDRIRQWKNTQDLWVYGYWNHDWADAYIKVKNIDAQNGVIVLEPPQSIFGYKENQRFCFLNILEELDKPGEYYLDNSTGVLYFWPPAPIDNAQVSVSLLENPLVTMNNVSHVIIRDIKMECTRSTGIVIEGGTAVLIAGCEICDLGQDGVIIQGGSDHKVVSCDIHDIGEAGITLQGGDRLTLEPSGHSAVNNHIHDFGFWVRTYQQGVRISGVGQRIANNYIHDAPHAAISYGGNDHIIEYNHIHDVALDSGDVGVIYTGRDWSMRGTIIRNNYIHDTGSRMSYGTMAVYLDDLSSGNEVNGNIFVRAGQGVFIGGGRDNNVENNIFIDGEYAVHIDNRGKGSHGKLVLGRKGSWDMFGKLETVPYNKPPYSTRYPGLANLLDQDPLEAKNNVIIHNIKVGNGIFLHVSNVNMEYQKVEDNFVDSDPGFAGSNPGETGFRFQPDSPVLKAGFKPIPFDMIGLHEDEYRRKLPEK